MISQNYTASSFEIHQRDQRDQQTHQEMRSTRSKFSSSNMGAPLQARKHRQGVIPSQWTSKVSPSIHAQNDLLTKKAASNSEIRFEMINDENSNSADILNNFRNFKKLLTTFGNTFGSEELRDFDSRQRIGGSNARDRDHR